MDIHEFEVGLARAILQASPGRIDALQMLGQALTACGRHGEALEVDQRVVVLAPADPTAHYNLACSRSNLGDVDRALQSLEKAFDLGYCDYKHLLRDKDLENVRRDPRFRRMLDKRWGRRQSRK